MKKHLSILTLAMVSLLVASCNGNGGNTSSTTVSSTPNTSSSSTSSSSTQTVNVAISGPTSIRYGGTINLLATVTGSANTAVIWSTDSNVVAVSDGTVIVIKEVTVDTTVTITATSVADNTKSASYTITVLAPEAQPELTDEMLSLLKDEKIDFDRYLDYMHGQVKELVTNYGKLDLLWFDFSYDDMTGEKWKATDLIKMVRHYQPDVIIDNRLEGAGDNHGSIATEHPLIYSGDFASPEQIIPPKGVCDVNGEPIPWELCATMNNHWGYCNFDHQYKTPEMLVRKLVECVSKGGNMILNVGPDAKGNIPQESVEILREVGNWMSKNKESIYGCGISNFEKPDWGRYTQKDNVIYAHVYETPLGALPLYGISPEQLAEITYLADGSEVKRGEAWNTALYTDVAFVSFGEDPVFTYPLPDERDTVLKIQLKN